MADQNKDETKPILSGLQPGPGEHLTNPDEEAGSTVNASSSNMHSASNTAASSVSGTAKKAAASVKESGARFADEAKHYASDMANIAKEKSQTMFQQQKDTALGQVGSITHAFRSTAQNLQGEGQDQIGRYIDMAADKLESLGNRLQQKDLDTLIDDTQNLARRNPAVFFAGTVAAGLLLSRFLKSSSERRRDSIDMSNDEWRTPSEQDAGTFTNTAGARSATATGVASTSMDSTLRTSGMSESTLDGTSGTLGPSSTLSTGLGTASTDASSSAVSGSTTGGNAHGTR